MTVRWSRALAAIALGVALVLLVVGVSGRTRRARGAPYAQTDVRGASGAPTAGACTELTDRSATDASFGGRTEAFVGPAPTGERASPTLGAAHARLARLRVHVRVQEDRAPYVGALVAGADEDGFVRWRPAASSHAGLREAAYTDASGCAVLDVEPGRSMRVHVRDDESSASVEHALSPMREGEEREIVLELPTQEDVRLHGRLVAADSGVPLAGTITVLDGAREIRTVQAGADGRFELTGCSWQHARARAESPGRAHATFAVASGHESADRPLTIRLERHAALEIVLRDESGAPVHGRQLEVHASEPDISQALLVMDRTGGTGTSWKESTDDRGTARFSSVVPRALLRVCLRRDRLEEELARLRLLPGEQRRPDLTLGVGATITGRLIDETGEGVADVDVWRIARSEAIQSLEIHPYDGPAAIARTDARGAFRFESVRAGEWWIGPPLALELEREDALVGKAFVHVTGASQVLDVVVRAARGRHLRGRVLDDRGAPAHASLVRAELLDAGGSAIAAADREGYFELAGVPPGRYRVHAWREALDSDSVDADAGAAGIVLHLSSRDTGEIEGRLVAGPARKPSAGELARARVDLDERAIAWRRQRIEDGSFLDPVRPGTYVIVARSRDGSIAVRPDVIVANGERTSVGALELRPGATLRISCGEGEGAVRYRVRSQGAPIDAGELEPAEVDRLLVPAGVVEVRWESERSTRTHVVTIEARAHDDRELVLASEL